MQGYSLPSLELQLGTATATLHDLVVLTRPLGAGVLDAMYGNLGQALVAPFRSTRLISDACNCAPVSCEIMFNRCSRADKSALCRNIQVALLRSPRDNVSGRRPIWASLLEVRHRAAGGNPICRRKSIST